MMSILDEVLFTLNPSSIWGSASVTDEPEITLIDWVIKEAVDGSRYFVGTRTDDRSYTGRVSTKVVEFDSVTNCGKTKSGRVYSLVGKPGYSSHGDYVWSIYKKANQIVEKPDVA